MSKESNSNNTIPEGWELIAETTITIPAVHLVGLGSEEAKAVIAARGYLAQCGWRDDRDDAPKCQEPVDAMLLIKAAGSEYGEGITALAACKAHKVHLMGLFPHPLRVVPDPSKSDNVT